MVYNHDLSKDNINRCDNINWQKLSGPQTLDKILKAVKE